MFILERSVRKISRSWWHNKSYCIHTLYYRI